MEKMNKKRDRYLHSGNTRGDLENDLYFDNYITSVELAIESEDVNYGGGRITEGEEDMIKEMLHEGDRAWGQAEGHKAQSDYNDSYLGQTTENSDEYEKILESMMGWSEQHGVEVAREQPVLNQRQKYDEEFKQNAVQLSYASPKTVHEIAEDLGIHENLLYNWRKKYTESEGKVKHLTREDEIRALKRELAEVRMERDMLKKAATYFASLQK